MDFKKELIIFSLCLLTANAMRFGGMMLGGWNEWQDANEDMQSLADSFRDSAEAKLGPFKMFNAASYKEQVVSGMNYNIRVDVGQETYLEMVVYKHWSGRTSLTSADMTDELIPPPMIVDCLQNQEFNECGTACPKKCGEPEALFCTMQCVIGCQCPWGMWEKDDGSCVENEDECYDIVIDKECPHNQEYTDCGTACPKICGKEVPNFCTYQCVVGCQCPSGWWQKEDGSCVENEDECGSSDPGVPF